MSFILYDIIEILLTFLGIIMVLGLDKRAA